MHIWYVYIYRLYVPQIFVFRNPTCQNVSNTSKILTTASCWEAPHKSEQGQRRNRQKSWRWWPRIPNLSWRLQIDSSQGKKKSQTEYLTTASVCFSLTLRVAQNSCSPMVSGQFDNLLPSWVGHHLRSVLSLVDRAESHKYLQVPSTFDKNNKNQSIIFFMTRHFVPLKTYLYHTCCSSTSPHISHRRFFVVGRSHIIPGMETKPTTFMPRVACAAFGQLRLVVRSTVYTVLLWFYISAPINCMDLNGV